MVGTLLHDHDSLRLVVLNACEGARNSKTDMFAGVATTFVRQGIPAVAAMQFEITDDAAITFATGFYTALTGGFPVDTALSETRKAIYIRPNDVEWGTPVLYMRSQDGVLFNMTENLQEKISPLGAIKVEEKEDVRPSESSPQRDISQSWWIAHKRIKIFGIVIAASFAFWFMVYIYDLFFNPHPPFLVYLADIKDACVGR
jgi:hypothetical protein